MKRIVKAFALSLICPLFLGLFGSLTASAAREPLSGLMFQVTDLYKANKGYTATPNTFEATIRINTNFETDGAGVLFSNNTGSNRSVVTLDVAAGGHPRLSWTNAAGQTIDWTFAAVNVCTNRFLHLAIVRDTAAGKVLCFVDGQLKQSLDIGQGTENIIPSDRFVLGGDSRKENPGWFRGWCRDLIIFSDARTASEVAADRTAVSKSESGLLGYYDFVTVDGTYKGDAQRVNKRDESANACDFIFQNNYNWLIPAKKPDIPEYAYSIALIPDPQILNWIYPQNYDKPFRYILDNLESQKIKMVIGLGDFVQTNTAEEWTRAKEGFYAFDGKVPYQVVRGNHDMAVKYKLAFPYSKYEDQLESAYEANMLNNAYRMTIGEVKYLFIGLDYGAGDAALAWASALCEKYPDHNVIVSTHAFTHYDGQPISYENSNNPPQWESCPNNGDDLWNKFIKKHKNITMVLCGHVPADGIVMTKMTGDHGNTVTTLLVDGQNADGMNHGGLGFVGMMHFSADGKQVTFDYYSTVKRRYFLERNQFDFTVDTVQVTEPLDGLPNPSGDQPGLSPWGIIGMVLGAIALCGGIGAAAVLASKKKKK